MEASTSSLYPEGSNGAILNLLQAVVENLREEMRKNLEASSIRYWESRGFLLLPAVPLLSNQTKTQRGEVLDDSVLFIGSNTNIIKNYLTSGVVPESGLCTSQPKLRLQNYRSLYTNELFRFASYFCSIGLTVVPSRYAALVRELAVYFKDVLCLDPSRIVVKTFGDEELVEPWRNLGFHISTEDDSARFDWKFGVLTSDGTEKLRGRGVYFDIIGNSGALCGEWASLEAIADVEKGPIAYEFGMGYEAFLASRERMSGSASHPLCFSQMARIVDAYSASSLALRVADSVLVVLAILNETQGLRLGSFPSKASYSFFRRFERSAYFHMIELKIGPCEFHSIVEHCCHGSFHRIPADLRSALTNSFDKYQERYWYFVNAISALLNGNTLAAENLPSVRRSLRAKIPLNLFRIAEDFGIIEFSKTRFYLELAPKLIDGHLFKV